MNAFRLRLWTAIYGLGIGGVAYLIGLMFSDLIPINRAFDGAPVLQTCVALVVVALSDPKGAAQRSMRQDELARQTRRY